MSKSLDLTPEELLSVILTETALGHIRWDRGTRYRLDLSSVTRETPEAKWVAIKELEEAAGVCPGCLTDLRAWAKGDAPDFFPANHDRAATIAEVLDYLETP